MLMVLGPDRSAKSSHVAELCLWYKGSLSPLNSFWELWQSLSVLETIFSFFYISLWMYS